MKKRLTCRETLKDNGGGRSRWGEPLDQDASLTLEKKREGRRYVWRVVKGRRHSVALGKSPPGQWGAQSKDCPSEKSYARYFCAVSLGGNGLGKMGPQQECCSRSQREDAAAGGCQWSVLPRQGLLKGALRDVPPWAPQVTMVISIPVRIIFVHVS